MKLSSSTSRNGLTAPLFGDAAVDAAVGDDAFVRAMLDAETALSLAAADVGVIPADAAHTIGAVCAALDVDITQLGQDSVSSGNPVVPLVALIGAAVGPDAAPWVHHGATSQDIIDTALMLMSKQSSAVILDHLGDAAEICAALAAGHRDTIMVARTLGQQAAPTTFGRKAAGWLIGLCDATERLVTVRDSRLAAQLGGPVGTLAAYGDQGDAVVTAYSARLGLQAPTLAWHTDRQRVIELAAALGAAAAAAAKIATDIVLMAQSEVGEVGLAAAGGSSSMPHKHNPIDAILVLAGTSQVPGLVATLLAAASPEHERATGSWHSEWQPWRELLSVVGGVTARTATLLAGLYVNGERMRANLDATGGLIMAESVAAHLAGALGRGAAHDLVGRCAERAATTGQPFAHVLTDDAEVMAHIDAAGLADALDPASWLGTSSSMIDRALAAQQHQRWSTS